MTPDRRKYETVDLGALVELEVPREWFAEAVAAAKAEALRPASNVERREQTVMTLIHDLVLPEHMARLLCELAVLFLKHEERRP